MATGDSLATFSPLSNEPPATAYATLDTRNSHPTLDFDDAAATESAVFSFVLPRNYGGSGITVYLHWAATTATTGNVIWQTARRIPTAMALPPPSLGRRPPLAPHPAT